MLQVIGNTPQRVELKDLGDYVYYKQQKVFTDAQYNRSQDLQREIQKGSLTILKRTEEKNGSFELPSVIPTAVPAAPAPTKPDGIDSSSKLDVLLERIQGLESAIHSKSTAQLPADLQSDIIRELTEKITRLESGDRGFSDLLDSVRRLEERIDKGSAGDEILQKLEGILSRAPTVVSSQERPREETRPEDVYVPSITVEDGNTHIKLNVRSIESGDSVSDSLRKLKELKSKSK
jgi:hypothetical protein